MFGLKPYGQLQYRDVNGKPMAYVDEGDGDAIVFAHGNPTSSYVWRNVMPHLEGLGRLVAADMVGMGGSDKLSPSGPDRYQYAEQRDYLFALWDALDLGDKVTLVLHDWGSVLGFDWANQHRDRVQGIAFMEAIVAPMTWSEFPGDVREVFQGFRSPAGERMVLEQNIFVESVLPAQIQRQLSDQEMDHYRQPFANPGEDRRPTLSWPRNLPIDGEPANVVSVVEAYSSWLADSDVPKLFINAEPGAVVNGRIRQSLVYWCFNSAGDRWDIDRTCQIARESRTPFSAIINICRKVRASIYRCPIAASSPPSEAFSSPCNKASARGLSFALIASVSSYSDLCFAANTIVSTSPRLTRPNASCASTPPRIASSTGAVTYSNSFSNSLATSIMSAPRASTSSFAASWSNRTPRSSAVAITQRDASASSTLASSTIPQ